MKEHPRVPQLPVYREFPFSWLLTGILIPVYLIMFYFYIIGPGDRPLPTGGFLILTGLFVFLYLIFYGMTTVIDKDHIILSFGIGLIRKKIKIERVKNVRAVRNPWYYGYGIRLIPNGWLYNVSGPHAVELQFCDQKRVVMIGTKKPAELKSQIERKIVK